MPADLYPYGVAVHLYKPLIKRAVVDFAVSADFTPSAGDVKISKDGGAAANVTNLPTAITMGNTAMWDFSITATEMQAAKVRITVSDSATKAVEDVLFEVDTYGNASAQHAVNLNDSVRAGLTALPNAAAGANGGLPTGDANARVDVIKIAGTTQTARDIGASVLLSTGTGTGQLDFTSGVVKANLAQILGTALTETAGQIAAGFKKLFDVAAPVFTLLSVNQTGDSFVRLGAPAGASVSADVAAVKAQTATINADTDDIQTRIPAALVSGRMDSSVGAMAANVMTAAAAAADLTTELQTGLATAAALATTDARLDTEIPAILAAVDTEVASILTIANKLDTAVELDGAVYRFTTNALEQAPAGGGGGGIAAGDVWDVPIASHLAAGTTGAKLNGLSGASGSGSISHTITVTSGGNPVDGAQVWVTATSDPNSAVLASGISDALGHVTVNLDANTYWQHAQRGGINFTSSSFTVA